MEWELRLRGVFDPEILIEMESHLLDAFDDGIHHGMDQQEAQQQALVRFGSAHSVARQFFLERQTMKQKLLMIAAVMFGLLVAYVDTRPTWDDTGITVFSLLLGGGIIGLLAQKRPWFFALAVGLWLPLWTILKSHDLAMIILLVIPFFGVYAGWVLNLGIHKLRQTG